MAITFPLPLPFERPFAQVAVRPNSVVEANVSPFTAEEQTYAHQGQFWVADLVLPPQKGAAAAVWRSWLTKLNGREGTFLMGDPSYNGPRGAALGAPLVNGAGQTGLTLAVDNFNPSVTGILREGDYIGLGSGSTSRLYMVVADADSNAFGQCTLEIWPRLRTSPADNAVIEIANPRTVWRLTSNEREWGAQPGLVFSMRFGAREAL